MDYTLNLFFFILILLICIYYLQKINQCGQRYQELKQNVNHSLVSNQKLSQFVHQMEMDLESSDSIETYVNYKKKCNRTPDISVQQCNKNVDLDPTCSYNQRYNPHAPPNQPSRTELVGDDCSLRTPKSHKPIIPDEYLRQQPVDKGMECSIKKAEQHLKKGIQAMAQVHKENEQRKCAQHHQRYIGHGKNPKYELNSINYPLISPCYDAYKRCIEARTPNVPYVVNYGLDRDLDTKYPGSDYPGSDYPQSSKKSRKGSKKSKKKISCNCDLNDVNESECNKKDEPYLMY